MGAFRAAINIVERERRWTAHLETSPSSIAASETWPFPTWTGGESDCAAPTDVTVSIIDTFGLLTLVRRNGSVQLEAYVHLVIGYSYTDIYVLIESQGGIAFSQDLLAAAARAVSAVAAAACRALAVVCCDRYVERECSYLGALRAATDTVGGNAGGQLLRPHPLRLMRCPRPCRRPSRSGYRVATGIMAGAQLRGCIPCCDS